MTARSRQRWLASRHTARMYARTPEVSTTVTAVATATAVSGIRPVSAYLPRDLDADAHARPSVVPTIQQP